MSVTPDSTAVCPGKSVPLQASGSERYQWIGVTDGLSATDIADPVARPEDSTVVYEVVGGDSLGCFSDTLRVKVVLLPAPAVSAGPDETVQAGTPVTLAGAATGDVVSWLWTPATYLSCTDCAQPVCTPKEPEQYIATVTGGDGCTASDTVVVSLLCDESKVRIPDAFTPNGDGHNDRWNILGISEVNHLVIFDRWGEKVFERDHYYPADAGAGWDGTVDGRPAPAGVYVYYAQMQCPVGGAFERRGTVVLVR
jgi:gliding motility-associated-like protein